MESHENYPPGAALAEAAAARAHVREKIVDPVPLRLMLASGILLALCTAAFPLPGPISIAAIATAVVLLFVLNLRTHRVRERMRREGLRVSEYRLFRGRRGLGIAALLLAFAGPVSFLVIDANRRPEWYALLVAAAQLAGFLFIAWRLSRTPAQHEGESR